MNTPVSRYIIDGQPLSKRTLHRLRLLCRREHEARISTEHYRDQALSELDVMCAESQAWHDRADGLVVARDKYKKESIDNLLKLTAAETDLAEANGTIAAMRRDVAGWWRPGSVLLVGLLMLAAGLTVGFLWPV